jgi:pimeloyl-ACP methyl ester carboxylesterase
VLIGIVTVLVLAVAALYLVPLGDSRIAHGRPVTMTFVQARTAAQTEVDADSGDSQVVPRCRSIFLSHGTKTAKSVLLLHGYTACPDQYAALGQVLFARGYNVYIPRAPLHGLTDTGASDNVRTDQLVTYADDALNVAAGLGAETGVIGISGGADLATWLAEYRTDVVSHLLVMSPFYRPNSSQAPGFADKPLTVLFGFHLVPDHHLGNGFSFRALSQYLRVAADLKDHPSAPHLKSVAAVISPGDTFIDHPAAFDIPAKVATGADASLQTRQLSPALGLAHNIVSPDVLGPRAAVINQLYADLYEGGPGNPPAGILG